MNDHATPGTGVAGVWTEGVCGDGAAILHDGTMVPISELLKILNENGSVATKLVDAFADALADADRVIYRLELGDQHTIEAVSFGPTDLGKLGTELSDLLTEAIALSQQLADKFQA
jgi:hypothetical protein